MTGKKDSAFTFVINNIDMLHLLINRKKGNIANSPIPAMQVTVKSCES